MIDIREATFRDVSFVAANMRDRDWREVSCQLPEGASALEAARICFDGSDLKWCAWGKGSPVCAFGFSRASHCGAVWSAWAFGSDAMRRAIPCVSRFGREVAAAELIARGARRLEVRSIEGHDVAHRWLEGLGARREACLYEFGRSGEAFTLWSWTLASWRAMHSGSREQK